MQQSIETQNLKDRLCSAMASFIVFCGFNVLFFLGYRRDKLITKEKCLNKASIFGPLAGDERRARVPSIFMQGSRKRTGKP
jgi:hypothetical protein